MFFFASKWEVCYGKEGTAANSTDDSEISTAVSPNCREPGFGSRTCHTGSVSEVSRRVQKTGAALRRREGSLLS
jgi:hypothetical protein